MAEREDAAEVSLSVRNEEDLSPECVAWADSCIISFPDDSDNNNWGTLRDALTEIIDIHPEMFVFSSTTGTRGVMSPDEVMTESETIDLRTFEPEAVSANSRTNSSNEEVSEIISMLTFESDPSKNSLEDYYFPESIAENGNREPADGSNTDLGGVESIEEDGSVSNGEAEVEEPASVSSRVFKDDFMSTYVEDNADDCNVTEDPVKVTSQEIFKVWDLEVVGDNDEEDGLVLQLKKALDESSTVQPLPQPLNDNQVVSEKSNIDDLISGISDLSLAETFK
ncbi:hypothetical protein AtNW77_Chr4g0318841 [Arabidopsis thaliana]|uniref:Uncharacterized protein n=2 Tax=Arabidopsis TaxID=3701 RepID=A0A178V4Z1_ARATH|nr:hypothetical protein ISN45_At04g041360 [Arabidopsis thaliana x Arabidopsis arenosa]OAO99981.1 hypothetical protein AXX17_AT4G44330 [Arabidopsis thaliana]